MNAIHVLSAQPWVQRLGSTLLHFLWQGLLLSGFYALARRSLTRSRPDARYLAACLTMAAMLAAPIATFLYLGPVSEPDPPPDATARFLHLPPQQPGTAIIPMAFVQGKETAAWSSLASPWIVAIWLSGTTLFCLRFAGGWWVTSRMRSRPIRPSPPEWQQSLTRLCAAVRISRPVRLLVSARVDVPMVVGWLRPVVLTPVGALAGLPPEQVEALLLHELAHIARRDYLVNALQNIAEASLFYHPAVWWISGHIRAERELCCDDLAVAATGDAFLYATALAGLERHRPMHARHALASNGGNLADRIARLLGRSRSEPRILSASGAAVSVFLLAISAGMVFGQPAESPKFEVASVNPSPRPMSYSALRALPGGRLHIENLTVVQLITSAYHLQDFQVVGGPPWIHDVGFHVEAKGDASANRARLMLMLQPLLEERFQLKFHRETRELPVYALVVANGGAKLPPPRKGACVEPEATAPPGIPPDMPPCGSLSIMMTAPSGMRARGGDVPMHELIRSLSMLLGRPVVDRTGMAPHFDVDFTFTPDDTTAGIMMTSGSVAGHRETLAAAAAEANDPKAPPTIQAALREQLGLRLDTAKGPVDVLVIDRVEKPSGN